MKKSSNWLTGICGMLLISVLIAGCGGGGSGSSSSTPSGTDSNPSSGGEIVGFASLGTGTSGGAGGQQIVVTSGQQLADIMKPREKTSDPKTPLILYISGTISGYTSEISIKRTGNISILGIGNNAVIQDFGFKIVDSSNIVIRNIAFRDCHSDEKDGIAVEGCNNIWVDHCSFTDSPDNDPNGSRHDGSLDIKKGSYNVTVSWNHFMNHRKTCLLGHSKSETGDVNLAVTYHHNWFDGTYSRHPRARYGKAHIFNNYYSNVGILGSDRGGYGVGSTCQAQVYLEANYFENTPHPTLISQINDPGNTLSGEPAGYLKASNNYRDDSSGEIVEYLPANVFDPRSFYPYTAENAQSVKNSVMSGAGPVLNLVAASE